MAEEKKDVDVSAEASAKTEEVKVEEAAPAAAEAKTEEAAPAVAEAKTEGAAEEPAEESKSRLPTAADLLADEKIEPIKRKKGSKNVPFGIAFVKTTFNNTIVTITDDHGNTVAWGSAGAVGFKGSRKSTPFASRLATEKALKAAMDMGLREVDMFVKGPGPGRESAIRAVSATDLRVKSISDVTPVPHNGCRPPKRRRV